MPTERIIFLGRVQGVGFRYTVRSLAKLHPVTGYVKNLPDGSVELVAQGDQQAVNGLLADVSERFRGNIDRCERQSVPDSETFQTFDIQF